MGPAPGGMVKGVFEIIGEGRIDFEFKKKTPEMKKINTFLLGCINSAKHNIEIAHIHMH